MGGGNSKQQFLERVKIVTEGNPPRSPEFWVSLWLTSVTQADIWETLTPDVIRKMKKAKPKNLHMLLVHVCSLSSPTLPISLSVLLLLFFFPPSKNKQTHMRAHTPR